MASAQLPPIHPSLGTNLSYCMHKPTTLIIKERGSFHEAFDSFPITDEHGHLLLTCRHIHNSLSSLLDVFDKHGHLLVTLKSRPEGGHRSFYGQASDGKVVFELREVLRNQKKGFIATFQNASNKEHIELRLGGNWFERSAVFCVGNHVAARVSKVHDSMRQMVNGYFVNVAPGVDLSLVAAICICLDQTGK